MESRLTDTLREAIKAATKRGKKTFTELSYDARVPLPVITRFVHEQRDVKLSSADKLANALGLELVRKK